MNSLDFDIYKETVENSPNCCVLIHKDGQIIYTNKSALMLFTELKNSQITGKKFIDFISPENKNDINKFINDNNDTAFYNEEFSTINGIKIKGKLTVIPIDCEGAKSIIIQNDNDYTKANLKEDYFANIVHELKNPVNVILSAVQLINMYINNNQIIDKKMQLTKYMNVIEQSGDRLIKNINELINIRKIEEGYLNLNLCNCDIVALINSIIFQEMDEAIYLGIDLNFKSSFKKKMITCDVEKIESIFYNLISNALKFTKEGGKVTVSLSEKDNKLIFSVKDTGIGISASDKNIIFEKYRQCENLSNTSGSGVGLYTVKLMVEAHNGSIFIESELGKGSEFIIEIPDILDKDKTEVSFALTKNQSDISQLDIINY